MSIEERDDAMCRDKGWATVSEQKAYWEKKEREQKIVTATIDSLTRTLEHLTKAVEGVLVICKDQQRQIDNITINKRN